MCRLRNQPDLLRPIAQSVRIKYTILYSMHLLRGQPAPFFCTRCRGVVQGNDDELILARGCLDEVQLPALTVRMSPFDAMARPSSPCARRRGHLATCDLANVPLTTALDACD
jgi:hypothetical protein